jgi:L-iditol 2-dehydrogenase
VPWTYRVDGPGFVTRIDIPRQDAALQPGQVRLKFRAGGLCGSDMPLLQGVPVDSVSGSHDGAPIHEIVGEVVESASQTLAVGQKVVGTGGAASGLAEFLVESDTSFIPIPAGFTEAEAVPIQSIGTVLRAAKSLPDIRGKNVAVIGAGPIGLAFTHLLRQGGARRITAIDPVPRREAALHYGADEFMAMHSARWVANLNPADRPEIVVEAVGHQQGTIRDAIRSVANGGYVLGFGAADDSEYAIPYAEMYERGITLSSGRTLDGWVDVLNEGRDYLIAHRQDFAGYLTHVVPIDDAQTAYALYARPQTSRIKVALVDES